MSPDPMIQVLRRTHRAPGEGCSVPGSDRRWVLIVPVDRLYLTEAVDREFRVDRVLFVHGDKLPYVRKRLGLGVRVSELKKHPWSKELFERWPAFAVVGGSGTQEEVEQQCLGLVREELALARSQDMTGGALSGRERHRWCRWPWMGAGKPAKTTFSSRSCSRSCGEKRRYGLAGARSCVELR